MSFEKVKPLVSIIIPTYNRAHLIGETLDSIIEQTYTNWECIVVDDGSTDITEELLKEYCNKDSRFQYYNRPNEKVKGPSSSRNYGFEQTKGEYINWFDDDDLMAPNAIKDRIDLFEADTDVVICKLQYYNFLEDKIIDETNIISYKPIEDYLIGDVTYFVSGPIWKRSFLEQQNYLFDETISNLDDWDFNLRMLYVHPNLKLLNLGLIKYRIHDDSLTRQLIKENFEEMSSECKARLKHLKLLLFKRNINLKNYYKFVSARSKNYLLRALLSKNDKKYYIFITLLVFQLMSYDFIGIFRASLGFTSYSIINKGYIFFKG
ncbi:Glycosyltransferase involved in cell wall bisynthesis [Lutibacter agarilyticus]|uniref:Glycosyltransferase involved in cell wall bisynthesis n=1 Tax=Lutibacter agarilyticus TaxID=1109740 RepID=A0A238YY06_9FLAO|nr:glycosyltransferase family 2 protein [Lutibacter agarilyticus]SNR76116.1 Glycosyltransferase involved in cell wall bisynthesis [Lutibacter agarilyticus]